MRLQVFVIVLDLKKDPLTFRIKGTKVMLAVRVVLVGKIVERDQRPDKPRYGFGP